MTRARCMPRPEPHSWSDNNRRKPADNDEKRPKDGETAPTGDKWYTTYCPLRVGNSFCMSQMSTRESIWTRRETSRDHRAAELFYRQRDVDVNQEKRQQTQLARYYRFVICVFTVIKSPRCIGPVGTLCLYISAIIVNLEFVVQNLLSSRVKNLKPQLKDFS